VPGGGKAQRAIETGIAGHTCDENLHSHPSLDLRRSSARRFRLSSDEILGYRRTKS
jgi:hypothetical protein